MHYYKEAEEREHGNPDFPFGFYDTDYTHPRYQMIAHWHPQWEMIYIIEGSLALEIDGKNVSSVQGDIVLIPGGKIHSGKAVNARYYCLVFDIAKIFFDNHFYSLEINNILKGIYQIPHLLTDTLAAPLCVSLMELFFKPVKGYQLQAVGMLYMILGTIIRHGLYTSGSEYEKKNKMNERILEILQIIAREYGEDISLSDMCDLLHLEKKYFCKCFKKITGKSFVSYLNCYRIQKACEQLDRSDKNVMDIAYECGFKDSSYFNRVFKQIKSTTPREYRDRL